MECSLLMVIFFLSFIGLVQSSCNLICSPGEFLSPPCNCLSCPNGTYNDKKNNDSKCHRCKKRCNPSMVVRKECNKTHDIVCSCNDGKYLDLGILFCIGCSVCKPGYGAEKPCSTDSNTVCLPCIPGKTYSNITSFSIPCKACTACPAGYSIKRKCTNVTDTVCQLTPSYVNSTQATQTKTRNSKGPSSTTGASIATEASKKDFVIPVVVAVAFFIIGLLIFLIVKVYRRSRARERQPDVAHRYSDSEEAIPIKSKAALLTTSRHGALRGRHTRHLRRNDSSRDSDSQGSSTGSLQEEKPRDPERLFRDLPNEPLVIQDLALSLNPKSRNNWVRLAGELGYSKIQIDNFGIDPTQATQNLLGDWRTMRNSTIGVLYACLQKMGRHDACDVLDHISEM